MPEPPIEEPPDLRELLGRFRHRANELEVFASDNPDDYESCSDEALLSPSRSKLSYDFDDIGIMQRPIRSCWIFHKNDIDPWPSVLHGHHNCRPVKLDAITGNIYHIQSRKLIERMRPKELKRIQGDLLGSRDFREKARMLLARE